MHMSERRKIIVFETVRAIENNAAIRAGLFPWSKRVHKGMLPMMTIAVGLGLLRLPFLLGRGLIFLPSGHDFPL
jgi:hypothetical protein